MLSWLKQAGKHVHDGFQAVGRAGARVLVGLGTRISPNSKRFRRSAPRPVLDASRAGARGVMKIVMLLAAIPSWLATQAVGFGAGLVKLFTDAKPQDLAPPSVVSTIEWLLQMFPRAVGIVGSPQQQVYSSIVLAIATFFTGVITGGAAWVLLGFWGVTLLIGLLRLAPAADGAVQRARNPVARVWDWLYRLVWEW